MTRDTCELFLKIPPVFWFGIGSVWKIFELKDDLIIQLMSNRGDCRTAPATPGLFNKYLRLEGNITGIEKEEEEKIDETH